MNMDPAYKQRWLEGLRSGKYTQGRQALRSSDDKYCVLGVLCDISSEGEWEERPERPGNYYYHIGKSYANGSLPFELQLKAKLSTHFAWVLIHMNDSEGVDFAKIADYIEEKL